MSGLFTRLRVGARQSGMELVERARWRLNRALERGNRPVDLFNSGAGDALAARTDRPFVYIPWVPSHGDALMQLVDARAQTLVPLPMFRSPDELAQRRKINAFVVDHPAQYREQLRAVLAPLRSKIAGVVLTLDWPPPMRQIVYACRELQIATVLLPHEAVFADRERYYRDRITGVDAPACDQVLCWGELQRHLFLERGVPAQRLRVVGSPKLDCALNFTPQLTRTHFAERYGLQSTQPIVLFALQPLDSQHDTEQARAAQNRAVRDLLELCGQLSAQLLVRCPPSGHRILDEELVATLAGAAYAAVDETPHRTSPHESIFHAACVCSINSTMLLEALLMKRSSISLRYVSFDDLWGQAGIPAAHNRSELATLLPDSVRSCNSRESGVAWAARAFSVGRFDGQSAQRIVAALREQRDDAPAQDDGIAHVFEEHVRAPRGTLGFVARDERAEQLAALLGYRRVCPPRHPQVADALVVRERDSTTAVARANPLHRPLLFVRPGVLHDAQTHDGTRLSALVDTCPAEGPAQHSRLIARLNSNVELSASQRTRAARCLTTLRGFLHSRALRPLGASAGEVALDTKDATRVTCSEPRHLAALSARENTIVVHSHDLGLVALLLELPVRCIGSPFYAGWGLTEDVASAAPRARARTLLELFHFACLEHSRYYSPATGQAAELEDVLSYLQQGAE